MHEWVHICSDANSGKNMKKIIGAFFWFGKKNNLLCVNGYIYVMVLMVNNMWRNPL
jgi:hypothetical protein